MTDRELMQDALDALNNFDKGNHGMRWQVPLIKALGARLAQPEPAQCDGGQCGIGGYCKECPKTKPEPEPEKSQDKPCVEDDGCPTEKAVLQRFWREHQAQPEQEPVTTLFGSLLVYDTATQPEPIAWTVRGLITDFSRDFSAYQTKTYTVPLYTSPHSATRSADSAESFCKPEPVAWAWTVNNGAGYITRGVGFDKTDIPFAKHIPLYTTPPQREWQGLTEADMDELIRRFARYELIRAVEAKLKEKNT